MRPTARRSLAALAAAVLAAAAPLAAIDAGTARGQAVYEGNPFPLAHAIAVERRNQFTQQPEIHGMVGTGLPDHQAREGVAWSAGVGASSCCIARGGTQ